MPGDAAEVFFDHDDLGFEVERGPEVQQVTTDHHGVEFGGVCGEPVELFEAVMEVGDEERFHGRCQTVAGPRRRKPEMRLPERSSPAIGDQHHEGHLACQVKQLIGDESEATLAFGDIDRGVEHHFRHGKDQRP